MVRTKARRRNLQPWAGLAAIGLMGLGGEAADAQVAFDTRALTGQQAAGTGPGVDFINFGNAVINDAGEIAFTATLTGTGIDNTNDSGLFSEAVGSIRSAGLVAREGDPAPGTAPGVAYGTLATPRFNDQGQTAFTAFLTGDGVQDFVNNRAIFSEAAGTLGSPALVARQGDAAPGVGPGINYNTLGNPSLSAAGQTVYTATLAGTGVDASNNRLIYSEAAGSIGSPGIVARTGDPAPGTAPGVTLAAIDSFLVTSLNDAGQATFVATLDGTGVDSTNQRAVYSEAAGSPGNPALVARAGDVGTPFENISSFFSFFNPNASGQFVYSAVFANANSSTDRALFSDAAGTPGNPALLAREGDQVPGAEAGVSYQILLDSPQINDAGETYFFANLTGPGGLNTNQTTLLSDAGSIGTPRILAREEDAAPGTEPGVNFASFLSFNVNNAGPIAFLALVDGDGVDFTNDRGIWATDPDGELTLIVREGDLLDVSNDPNLPDLRTISTLTAFFELTNETGGFNSLNDQGQLAFRATFTDGSEGLFVATIPEPTAGLVLLSLAGLVTTRRRRR